MAIEGGRKERKEEGDYLMLDDERRDFLDKRMAM